MLSDEVALILTTGEKLLVVLACCTVSPACNLNNPSCGINPPDCLVPVAGADLPLAKKL